MPSTFFGLNIGASGLSAFQTSVTTTANNVANTKTKGYTRQTATLQSTDAIRVAAKYGSVGTGVEVTSILQERNLFYDMKFWEANEKQGMYEKKLYYAEQVQTLLKDDKVLSGFATIFNQMFNNLDDISKSNADRTVRNAFINQAQSLCTYFNNFSSSLRSIQDDCNEEIKAYVENINVISQKISILNKEINQIEMNNGRANELRDERAVLVDELSAICNVTTKEYKILNTNDPDNYLGGTNYEVRINGQLLVDGNDYRTLECVSRKARLNQLDADGLYDIIWEDTQTDFAAATLNAGGMLKALVLERDGNNNENLKGTIREAATDYVVVDNLNLDSINAFSHDKVGVLYINNKKYNYTGWEAEVKDGKLDNVKFNLSTEISANDITKMNTNNSRVECGVGISNFGIPYYQKQATEFMRAFCSMFNAIELKGVDLEGKPMTTFFTANLPEDPNSFCMSEKVSDRAVYEDGIYTSEQATYYNMTIDNVKINNECLKNPVRFATAYDLVNGIDRNEVVVELKKLQSDIHFFRGEKASSFLETILSDAAIDAQRTTVFNKNYSNLATSIDRQRESISGVDRDEEAMNLIKFQNAYNLSSKIISVMAQMYDKLINETGV
ncbi:flagellar hook-associated protein FlgK [Lachnobacterium bovis]|uniref:Flagellar hook-associated protein 1 n=1 Tax=Lachnobacterium bovis TaxID=140626 RepID=A0A1H9SDY0_9FIRM|nr:flagellar basal body rod C-terminal domain-containing protein [Lachnobacterium bovis]SER83187.1 flagellar hook-associated protein 1 FlgK [Lachnobacterium bovis]